MDITVVTRPSHRDAISAAIALLQREQLSYATFRLPRASRELPDKWFKRVRQLSTNTPMERLFYDLIDNSKKEQLSWEFGINFWDVRKIRETVVNQARNNLPHFDKIDSGPSFVILHTTGDDAGPVFYEPRKASDEVSKAILALEYFNQEEHRHLLVKLFLKKQLGKRLGIIFRTGPDARFPLLHHSPNQALKRPRTVQQYWVEPSDLTPKHSR